eukprot:13144473-Alexandrium_andersonii.AAC.1
MQAPTLPPAPSAHGGMTLQWVPVSRSYAAWGQEAVPSSLHQGWAARGAEAVAAAGVAPLHGTTTRCYCDLCTTELTHVGPGGPSCPACCEALRLTGALAAH